MTDHAEHRHPSDYSDAELRRMLARERTEVLRRVVRIRQQLRELSAELAAHERRLEDIEASENALAADDDRPCGAHLA